jgi:hypothetical protein
MISYYVERKITVQYILVRLKVVPYIIHTGKLQVFLNVQIQVWFN